MATVASSKPATESSSDSDSVGKNVPKETTASAAPLGTPRPERKFWFQKRKNYDPTSIATLGKPSSFRSLVSLDLGRGERSYSPNGLANHDMGMRDGKFTFDLWLQKPY
ncbi:hypothetical protein ColLi_06296 [Colletotrichum liriopes]|uniref:Uncharacterized protein n=1 Tax=Colletotrichum liriopes TaxID=708192 RepID=A0AA37LTJ8_9PEZI|nr:hypothetical protein ColLi_06296 [Colletotrichum liriopes]